MKSGRAFGGNFCNFGGFRTSKVWGFSGFCRIEAATYLEHSRLRLRTSSDVRQKVFLFTTLAGHKTATSGVQISG
jgi:hypothetical protein